MLLSNTCTLTTAGSSGAAIGEISSSRRQSGGGREGDNFKADVSEHPLGTLIFHHLMAHVILPHSVVTR